MGKRDEASHGGEGLNHRHVPIFKMLARLGVNIRHIALIAKPFFYISKAFQRQTNDKATTNQRQTYDKPTTNQRQPTTKQRQTNDKPMTNERQTNDKPGGSLSKRT